MEHLTKAIEKLARNYGINAAKSFLGEVAKYTATGDEKLMPRLLKIGEADMNKLCAVARAVARPDKFGDADWRLIRFFARRSALLNGVDKGEPMGECSDWPLARCLERHFEKEQSDEDFCGIVQTAVRALGVPEARWTLLVARHVQPRAVNGRLTSAGRYLATQSVKELLRVMPALRYHCTDREFMPAFAVESPQRLGEAMDELIRKKKVDE